jgi:hypothetical protein
MYGFQNLTIPKVNAFTSRALGDQISNGKFIAAIEYINDFDHLAKKNFGVLRSHVKVNFFASDFPKRARMNKVLRELKLMFEMHQAMSPLPLCS